MKVGCITPEVARRKADAELTALGIVPESEPGLPWKLFSLDTQAAGEYLLDPRNRQPSTSPLDLLVRAILAWAIRCRYETTILPENEAREAIHTLTGSLDGALEKLKEASDQIRRALDARSAKRRDVATELLHTFKETTPDRTVWMRWIHDLAQWGYHPTGFLFVEPAVNELVEELAVVIDVVRDVLPEPKRGIGGQGKPWVDLAFVLSQRGLKSNVIALLHAGLADRIPQAVPPGKREDEDGLVDVDDLRAWADEAIRSRKRND